MATLSEALNESVDSEGSAIIPGTTPELKFSNINHNIIANTVKARLDVSQKDMLLFQTSETTIDKDNDFISHLCTQDETYQMEEGSIFVQVHAINSDGISWKTEVKEIKIGKSLSNTTIDATSGEV